jgi:hypothetical protein
MLLDEFLEQGCGWIWTQARVVRMELQWNSLVVWSGLDGMAWVQGTISGLVWSWVQERVFNGGSMELRWWIGLLQVFFNFNLNFNQTP